MGLWSPVSTLLEERKATSVVKLTVFQQDSHMFHNNRKNPKSYLKCKQ